MRMCVCIGEQFGEQFGAKGAIGGEQFGEQFKKVIWGTMWREQKEPFGGSNLGSAKESHLKRAIWSYLKVNGGARNHLEEQLGEAKSHLGGAS